MNAPRALVSGASIAGLCTAFWLDQIGWHVTVVERAPAFRDGGQNVDVRGIARAVLGLMGVEDQVRARTTTEEGTSVVDDEGHVIAAFPVHEQQDGPTAELEILRGDLARIVLEALPASVEVHFGDWIEHADATGAVTMGSGAAQQFDLVVIAEGVKSSTRTKVFGNSVDARPIGLEMAYGTIPRTAADDRWWRWHLMDGGRQVTLRPDAVGTIRATLAFTTTGARKRVNLADLGLEEARRVLADTFNRGGWETRRVVEGFSTSQDVYLDHLTQIRMPNWSQGRVCVVGDAAWCVTPLGGGGTSLAMTGAYVLAAYLSHQDGQVEQALHQYERWMRPLVQKSQSLPPGTPNLFYPRTQLGVRVRQALVALAARPRMRRLTTRVGQVARTDQQLPQLRRTAAGT